MLWSRGLVKERSRRMLERWRNFGCEEFEFRGAELADSIDERELLRRHSWRAQGGEGDEGEAQEGVRQVASSGRRRGRLGDARRPGKRDRPPRRQRHSGGASGELGAPLLRRAAQGDGWWVYDRWGPRVRKFLYFNPNFWIVTVRSPESGKKMRDAASTYTPIL